GPDPRADLRAELDGHTQPRRRHPGSTAIAPVAGPRHRTHTARRHSAAEPGRRARVAPGAVRLAFVLAIGVGPRCVQPGLPAWFPELGLRLGLGDAGCRCMALLARAKANHDHRDRGGGGNRAVLLPPDRTVLLLRADRWRGGTCGLARASIGAPRHGAAS